MQSGTRKEKIEKNDNTSNVQPIQNNENVSIKTVNKIDKNLYNDLIFF